MGFALACYCDLRFAADGAKLTTAHGRLGLPAEFGLSWLLPRLVGLTRPPISSCRAASCSPARRPTSASSTGSAPDALMDGVYDYARTLATEVSPASLAATKHQLYTDLHRDVGSAGRDAEGRMRAMMAGPDFAEGVAALTERRPPRFPDPLA